MPKTHEFTAEIVGILQAAFGLEDAPKVLENSPLLQYVNIKTASASRGSKSRGSFANLYAIYVLVEDFVAKGYSTSGDYSRYEGAQFSALFARQRQLPFGDKLQNHALNSRLNEEFRKYFPLTDHVPIIRDLRTSRYWISESLLVVETSSGVRVNIAEVLLEIIDAYVRAKRDSFQQFLETCQRLLSVGQSSDAEKIGFVTALLQPNVDARIFEIVSFAILKAHYGNLTVWIGWEADAVAQEALSLYKTGRTNANDGGIDFVMRPLGRFYQVTETSDLRKYFLDIDKIQKFPMTFVVKTENAVEDIRANIRSHAERIFAVHSVVESYVQAVEELINLPMLREFLTEALDHGDFDRVLEEMSLQARVEFNLDDDEEAIALATTTGSIAPDAAE